MSAFEQFKKKHGPPSQCERVTDASFEAYAGKVPDDLLGEWRESGWCAYGDGLLWTVNPEEFAEDLGEWLGEAGAAHAIARTAFGDIIYWDGEQANFLNVVFGGTFRLFHNMELTFSGALSDDRYLDDVIRRPIFAEALPRLGPPARDECYAFTPAVALGGPGTADTLQKVKLHVHLHLLAQLAGE